MYMCLLRWFLSHIPGVLLIFLRLLTGRSWVVITCDDRPVIVARVFADVDFVR